MTKDPKGRKSPGFSRHVFICGNQRDANHPRECCANKNSLDVIRQMKIMAKDAGIIDVRVQKSGCLDFCEMGISCVVYPEGVWYSITDTENDIQEIVEQHLLHGNIVERCKMKLE